MAKKLSGAANIIGAPTTIKLSTSGSSKDLLSRGVNNLRNNNNKELSRSIVIEETNYNKDSGNSPILHLV